MLESLMQSALVQDIVILAKPALFNMYFAFASIPIGFPLAVMLALGKASRVKLVSQLSRGYIYAFRGSPLFIQFFMFYSMMLALNKPLWKPWGIDDVVLHPLFLGPLVLILNTSAYAAEIFYGALKTVPKGEVEAALATGMNRWNVFRSVTWPNMLHICTLTTRMIFFLLPTLPWIVTSIFYGDILMNQI